MCINVQEKNFLPQKKFKVKGLAPHNEIADNYTKKKMTKTIIPYEIIRTIFMFQKYRRMKYRFIFLRSDRYLNMLGEILKNYIACGSKIHVFFIFTSTHSDCCQSMCCSEASMDKSHTHHTPYVCIPSWQMVPNSSLSSILTLVYM